MFASLEQRLSMLEGKVVDSFLLKDSNIYNCEPRRLVAV